MPIRGSQMIKQISEKARTARSMAGFPSTNRTRTSTAEENQSVLMILAAVKIRSTFSSQKLQNRGNSSLLREIRSRQLRERFGTRHPTASSIAVAGQCSRWRNDAQRRNLKSVSKGHLVGALEK
jgi:hypothetical protein